MQRAPCLPQLKMSTYQQQINLKTYKTKNKKMCLEKIRKEKRNKKATVSGRKLKNLAESISKTPPAVVSVVPEFPRCWSWELMVIMIYERSGLTFMYHKCQLSMSIYIMLPHCGYVSIWTYVSQKKKKNKVKIQNQKTEPTFFRPGLLVPVLFWALSPNRDWVTVLRKLVFLPRIQRSGSRGSQVFITLFSHSSMWVSLICWRLRWCCLVQSNPNQTNPIHFVRSFVCHSHLICFLG